MRAVHGAVVCTHTAVDHVLFMCYRAVQYLFIAFLILAKNEYKNSLLTEFSSKLG